MNSKSIYTKYDKKKHNTVLCRVSLLFVMQLKPIVLDLMNSSMVTDVKATFDNIFGLYDVHHRFVTELDKTVSNWSLQTSVGAHLRTLVSFPVRIYCCCVVDDAL